MTDRYCPCHQSDGSFVTPCALDWCVPFDGDADPPDNHPDAHQPDPEIAGGVWIETSVQATAKGGGCEPLRSALLPQPRVLGRRQRRDGRPPRVAASDPPVGAGELRPGQRQPGGPQAGTAYGGALMGARTMPYECDHGLILDWGDFGPDRAPEFCAACQPDVCPNCERCRWDPDNDCGIAEHPHCERCGHCRGRHGSGMEASR